MTFNKKLKLATHIRIYGQVGGGLVCKIKSIDWQGEWVDYAITGTDVILSGRTMFESIKLKDSLLWKPGAKK